MSYNIYTAATRVMARQSRSSNKGVPLGPLDVLYTTHTADIVLYTAHTKGVL
jgi:hypothetical protein